MGGINETFTRYITNGQCQQVTGADNGIVTNTLAASTLPEARWIAYYVTGLSAVVAGTPVSAPFDCTLAYTDRGGTARTLTYTFSGTVASDGTTILWLPGMGLSCKPGTAVTFTMPAQGAGSTGRTQIYYTEVY